MTPVAQSMWRTILDMGQVLSKCDNGAGAIEANYWHLFAMAVSRTPQSLADGGAPDPGSDDMQANSWKFRPSVAPRDDVFPGGQASGVCYS
jgi:hypothetical protein